MTPTNISLRSILALPSHLQLDNSRDLPLLLLQRSIIIIFCEQYSLSGFLICSFVKLHYFLFSSLIIINSYKCSSHNYFYVLWNLEVQSRIHKGSPIIPILSRINPITRIKSVAYSSQGSHTGQLVFCN